MGMKPGDRIDYTTIDKRPKLSLPNSAKIITDMLGYSFNQDGIDAITNAFQTIHSAK